MSDILNYVGTPPVEPVPFDDPRRQLVHVLASGRGAKTLCGLSKDQAGQYGPLYVWEAAKPEFRCEACAKAVAEPKPAAKAATKPAKASKAKQATKTAEKAKAAPTARKTAPTAKPAGEARETVRDAIWRLMRREKGTSEREVCDELGGWKKAGATISRAIKTAPFAVRKERGEDGRTRYFAE